MLAFTRRLALLVLCFFYVLPASAQVTEGMASYYADRFHAATTSTGETYDKQAFTAASQDYPYGTVLEVTEVVSGKKVRVRVNDCGPHNPDRIIDLSRAAAKQIDLLRKGTAQVRLRVVKTSDLGPTCEREAWAATQADRQAKDPGATVETTVTTVAVEPLVVPPAPTAEKRARGVTRKRVYAADEILFGVQVGAFGKEANAMSLVEKLTDLGFEEVFMAKIDKVHRVFAGKFYFQDEALQLRQEVREAGFRDASVRRVQ